MNFCPHLVPVTRGIHSSIFLNSQSSSDEIYGALQDAYGDEAFVRVLEPGKLADTKHVTMSNTCEIAFALDERTGKLILSSAIDNLTKGASGQALQCLNIMFGFNETEGLN